MNGISSQEALKQMYRSGIRASYFAGFKDPKFMEKSKLQITTIENQEQENVDEHTFRLLKGFKRPADDFIVYNLKGKCFLEQESFFSCFGNRRPYNLEMRNSKLIVTDNNENIARFVDFNVVGATVTDNAKGLTLRFEGTERQLYIEPQSNTDKWVQMISKIIKETKGQAEKLNYISSKGATDFFRTEHVLNEEFQKQANSGDIMLFRSQHSAATIQRLFTDSEYDHVGMVVRNQKNEIFILESTSDEGVGLTPWRHMIKYEWYNQTDKISWRKLNMEIGEREIEIIQMFVAKTLGKGFEISLNKLFQFKSTLNRTAEQEEGKTYFCSELVARLYKELGVLDESRASTNYYPVDFSQKGALKIIRPGVTLSNQILISFDR